MAKLLSGTRIYGNAVVDTFINIGGNVSANGTVSANGLIINGLEIFTSAQGANITVTKITANIWDNLYTSNVIEGLNLYFTNARVLTALTNSTVQGNLNLTGGLTANTVTANSFISTGAGVPTLSSATNINLAANGINGGAVVIQSSALRLNTYTNATRDLLTPSAGDLVYNSNTSTVQVYITSLGWKDIILENAVANVSALNATGNITANTLVANNIIIRSIDVTSTVLAGNITGTTLLSNNIVAYDIVTGNITANVWNNLYTSNVIETSGNLYFTNARVLANVSQMSINVFADVDITGAQSGYALVWDGSKFVPSASSGAANTAVFATNANVANTVLSISNFTTANLAEGSNLYYTNARVISAVLPYLTTSNVVEGTNLYYTNARVLANLATSDVSVNNLTVAGDLTVQGNTVTLNASTVNIEDKNLLLANGSPNAAAADGAGITIDGANANITYASTGDKFVVNKPVDITGALNTTGNIFVNGDQAITLNPLNQSLALLRSQIEAPVSNVLYVSKSGNDNNSGNSIANALANIHVALNRANSWTTVFVKSGEYTLYQQPVTIKPRVGLVGDNLRTTTIRPANVTQDMFYVTNACYVTGFTFRDHQSPSAVFSYNPDGSAGTIVTSPYIQNSSSITTTGTGLRVDGAYVSGLRSMVVDSYTQTNEGGIGMHMLNRGYTQLVSVFTICCDIAILAENGGFCSITNSNASFGRLGLVARGVSHPTYFGKFASSAESDEGTLYTINNLSVRPNYGDAVLFANYDQAQCSRDTGLVVDSLAFDLAYQSNTQSAFAGLQYWSQSTSAIANQATETIAAFSYAKNLATNVAINTTITSPRQANVTQTVSAFVVTNAGAGAYVIDGSSNPSLTLQRGFTYRFQVNASGHPFWIKTAAVTGTGNAYSTGVTNNGIDVTTIVFNVPLDAPSTLYYICQYHGGMVGTLNIVNAQANVNIIANNFNLVANIITGGTAGISDRIIPNGFPANTNVSVTNSANLVLSNKTFIQKEVIAFINQEYPGFFANANNFIDSANAITKCERDTGYLLDSIVFDYLHGGNRQSVTSGVYYYNNDFAATQIENQIPQTTAAYDFLGTIIDDIVRNITITSPYQNVYTQNTTVAASASLTEANLILADIDLITDIITIGANAAPTKSPISYSTLSNNSNVINATKIILANRDFIVAEVNGYINQNWANISNGSVAFFTVANSTPLVANTSIVRFLEGTVEDTLIANSTISFHQPSYISALGYTFEYIGSGTSLQTALPYNGGFPIQENEVTEEKGGRVYFTSTDQQGDFRIGTELVFNRVDGTISGRTFNKALFSVMTPYILAIEG